MLIAVNICGVVYDAKYFWFQSLLLVLLIHSIRCEILRCFYRLGDVSAIKFSIFRDNRSYLVCKWK